MEKGIWRKKGKGSRGPKDITKKTGGGEGKRGKCGSLFSTNVDHPDFKRRRAVVGEWGKKVKEARDLNVWGNAPDRQTAGIMPIYIQVG